MTRIEAMTTKCPDCGADMVMGGEVHANEDGFGVGRANNRAFCLERQLAQAKAANARLAAEKE